MTKNVLLCGVGGQGAVLVSRLIVPAAMEEGMEVRSAEAIGTAQRGGGAVSHVRIGREIYLPMVPHKEADVMIGLEPVEAVRCPLYLKKGGCVAMLPVPTQLATASLIGGVYAGEEIVEYLKQTVNHLVAVDGTSVYSWCGSTEVLSVALLGAVTASSLIGVSLEEVE